MSATTSDLGQVAGGSLLTFQPRVWKGGRTGPPEPARPL